MANTHTVTVFVWKNSAENDLRADREEKLSGTSAETGHAAMKLQEIGAAKGDYYYLSFWPGYHPISSGTKFHSMTGRMGPNSLKVANVALRADWEHKLVDKDYAMVAKKFPTSLDWAGDHDRFEVMGNQVPALGGDDKTAMGRKPNTKYRMNGLAMHTMVEYIKKITSYTGEGATGVPFHIADFNCSTAVAECLRAGGALNMPERAVWSPNRLGAWCDTLVHHYKGEKIA